MAYTGATETVTASTAFTTDGAVAEQLDPGGITPPVGGGGTIILPDTPGVIDVTNPTTGEPGSVVVIPEDPGDLGTRFTNLNTYLLLIEARRLSSTVNGSSPQNHRYRGHREAHKFNLEMQRTVTLCCSLFLTLRAANVTLTTSEVDDMYPTDAEISSFYHSAEQLRFIEWLTLKDEDKRWFV